MRGLIVILMLTASVARADVTVPRPLAAVEADEQAFFAELDAKYSGIPNAKLTEAERQRSIALRAEHVASEELREAEKRVAEQPAPVAAPAPVTFDTTPAPAYKYGKPVHVPGYWERNHYVSEFIVVTFLILLCSSGMFFSGVYYNGVGRGPLTIGALLLMYIVYYCWLKPMAGNLDPGVLMGGFLDFCWWSVKWFFSGMPSDH
jgi:hypothetical protein